MNVFSFPMYLIFNSKNKSVRKKKKKDIFSETE